MAWPRCYIYQNPTQRLTESSLALPDPCRNIACVFQQIHVKLAWFGGTDISDNRQDDVYISNVFDVPTTSPS